MKPTICFRWRHQKLEYYGEYTFAQIVLKNTDKLFDDSNGILRNCDGNVVSEDDPYGEIGTLDFDGHYDTFEVVYAEDIENRFGACTGESWAQYILMNERPSQELKKELYKFCNYIEVIDYKNKNIEYKGFDIYDAIEIVKDNDYPESLDVYVNDKCVWKWLENTLDELNELKDLY